MIEPYFPVTIATYNRDDQRYVQVNFRDIEVEYNGELQKLFHCTNVDEMETVLVGLFRDVFNYVHPT